MRRTRSGYLVHAAKNDLLLKETENLSSQLAALTQLGQEREAEVEQLRGRITDLEQKVLQDGQKRPLTTQAKRSEIIRRHSITLLTASFLLPEASRDSIEQAKLLSHNAEGHPGYGIGEGEQDDLKRVHAALTIQDVTSPHLPEQSESGEWGKMHQEFEREIHSAGVSIMDLDRELRAIAVAGEEAGSKSPSAAVLHALLPVLETKPLVQREDMKVLPAQATLKPPPKEVKRKDTDILGGKTAAEAEQLRNQKEAVKGTDSKEDSEAFKSTALMLAELQHDDILFSKLLQAQAKIDELIKECTSLRMQGILQVSNPTIIKLAACACAAVGASTCMAVDRVVIMCDGAYCVVACCYAILFLTGIRCVSSRWAKEEAWYDPRAAGANRDSDAAITRRAMSIAAGDSCRQIA